MNEQIKELKKLLGEAEELEVENLELEVDELVLNLRTRALAEAIKQKRKKIEPFRFTPPSDEYKGKISLIVNMADSAAEGKNTFRQISNVVRRFLNVNILYAGVLLKDDRLTSAVKMRKPVVLAYPKAKITNSLAALAVKLNGSINIKNSEEGFFRKVVDWFF